MNHALILSNCIFNIFFLRIYFINRLRKFCFSCLNILFHFGNLFRLNFYSHQLCIIFFQNNFFKINNIKQRVQILRIKNQFSVQTL